MCRGAGKKSYFINRGGGGGPEVQQCFSTRNNSQKFRIANSVLVKYNEALHVWGFFSFKNLKQGKVYPVLLKKQKAATAFINNFLGDLENTSQCSGGGFFC